MIKRILSLTLIVFHIITFVVTPDLLADIVENGDISHTKLLIHCDGSDGSSAFADEMQFHVVAANGDAQVDTAQKKFGGASGLFDGDNDRLVMPDSADWDIIAGDFTIDFWVKFNSITYSSTFVEHFENNANEYRIGHQTDIGLYFGVQQNGAWIVHLSHGSQSISDSNWHHVALSKNESTYRIFLDGVQIATTTDSDADNFAGSLYIGNDGGLTQDFNGWMDEIRISKGIARWTANFTPPTTPYGTPEPPNPTGYATTISSIGESIIGTTGTSQYTLNAGFIYTTSSPPRRTNPIPYDFTWKENQIMLDVFDLDDHFTSDEGYELTYTYKNLSADKFISVIINPNTHSVNFEHAEGFTGTEQVEFKATDEEGQYVKSGYINLSVVPLHAPVVTIDSATSPVSENETVTIQATATDEDVDEELTFTFTANSPKVELVQSIQGTNPATVEATWPTDYDDAGTYDIIVRATDKDGLYNEKEVQITVNNVNRVPVINTISGITATPATPVQLPDKNETDLVTIVPVALDGDQDAIIYSYNNLGSSQIDATGAWLTGYDDAGAYQVEVKAFDGNDYSDPILVNFTIVNVNRAPQTTLTLSDYTINKNDTVAITLTASDGDGDNMTFSLKKDGSELDSGSITDVYSTNLTIAQSGDYTIEAIVTDAGGLSTTDSALIDCVDPNVNRDYINPVMGDFNGDSKADLGLHNSNSDEGTWEICLSDNGEFQAAQLWLNDFGTSRDWLPLGGDYNGDGITDIGIYNNTNGSDGGQCKIALSTGSSFSTPSLWATFQESSYDWVPVGGNFNSDRFTDLAVYNSKTGEWRVALCDGSSFGVFTQWIDDFGGEGYSPLTGDFNADGIIDIGIFNKSSGEVKVAFGNTKTFIDSETTWISGFATNKNITIADFNNDGTTDIGYWDSSTGNWTTAVSNGTRFVESRDAWLSGFGSSSDESSHTGDFNGDGVTDAAVFDKDSLGIERWNVWISTNVRSDLLVEIDNGTGGKTSIEYDYAAKGQNDLLPFAVYVAKSATVTDYLPADQPVETYTQQFAYSGGYYDATEREFRGFEVITVTEPITGNYTKTYFYQGKNGQDGALKGKTYKVLAYDVNSRLISEVHSTWGVRKAGPTDGPLGFPHITQTSQTAHEENETSLTTQDSFTYDNLGNVSKVESLGDVTASADDRTNTTSYAPPYQDGFNRPTETSLTDQNSGLIVKKAFQYDIKGNLTKETAWLNETEQGPFTEYAYDEFGNLTSTTDALGRIVMTQYESMFYAFPERVTNSLGHTIQYTYDAKFGVVTSTTDPNGKTSSTVYDTYGRATEVRNALGELVTTYSYPDFNSKISTQQNLTSKAYIDGLGRKYKTVATGEDGNSQKDVISETFYDERGFVTTESLPHYIDELSSNISYVRYEYDIRGRLVKTISDFPGEGDDAESTISYIAPLEVETTDPKGHRKGTKKDVFGNTLEIIEYTQGGVYHTYYEYDSQNNLVKLTDSQGNITSIQYDALGRKTSMDDPDMGHWEYEYDLVGNLIKQTDAKGQVIEFEYDQLNRLIQKVLASQGPVPQSIQYLYDLNTNGTGRLSSVTDPTCTTNFYYDALGREIKTEKTIDATTYTVQRTYDTLDRLVSLTYPNGEVVNYAYDTNSGLIESVSSYVQDVTYSATGQMLEVQYGNNATTNYSYGNDLRLSRIFTQNSTATTLQDLNYRFDRNGNITQITDNLAQAGGMIRTFSYDDLDRLTEAENMPDPNGGYTTFQYEYNPIGNMTKKGPIYNLTYMSYGEGSAGPHAVTTAGGNSYLYDANGNMVSGHGKTLEYDAENRLSSFTYARQTTTFAYDGDGGRVKKASSSGTTTYVGSLYEVRPDGSTVNHIFLGSNRIASVTSPQGGGDRTASYYHSDHLGSSNVITNDLGEQVSLCEYTPYGKIAKETGSFSTPYKFTGKELDSTGLYFYGARYYDPELGRFIQADTLVVHPNDPQDLNRYAYCRNNPLNLVDPTGHGWFSKFFKKVGKAFKKAWRGIVAVAAVVAAYFVVVATGGTASPFLYPFLGANMGMITGGISAARAGGNISKGMLMGAGIGAVTGTAAGGFKDYFLNTAFANQTISAFQGGMITAGEFAIGGFGAGMISGYGGGVGNWNDMWQGAIRGAALGAAAGFAVGYSYTAGWQSFAHGAKTQAHNNAVRQVRKMAKSLGIDLKFFNNRGEKYFKADMIFGKPAGYNTLSDLHRTGERIRDWWRYEGLYRTQKNLWLSSPQDLRAISEGLKNLPLYFY